MLSPEPDATPNAAPQQLAPEAAPPPPPPPPTPEQLVDAQFQGPKAALRPIYEVLVQLAKRLGGKVVPWPGHVAFVKRGVPFAVVKVMGKDRLALALGLPDVQKVALRWKKSRKFCGVEQMTHRTELHSVQDVNGELVQWMKLAHAAKPARAEPTERRG